MAISRRALIRQFGAGAAATVILPSVARAGDRNAGFSRSLDTGDGRGLVRLHKNENPFGPSPRVLDAIRNATISVACRYPDRATDSLRTKIAALHHVDSNRIVLGCGSDDLLRRVMAVLGSGRTVIAAQPTYQRVIDYAGRAGADVALIPIRSDYSHDLDRMLSHARAAATVVYICNPNNPTGSLTRRRDLEAFIAALPATTHVIIDEAYHHYAGASSDYASFLDSPLDDRRIIVTRSFSTVHGLAGLRVGYAVADPATAARLDTDDGNSVSSVAALAAIAALDDTDHVPASLKRNADDRQEFCNQSNARMLRTIDSHANFVLLNTGHSAPDMIEHFLKHDVLVAGPFHPFDKHIRVSLGTPAEMREFWRVFDLLPPSHVMTM
jgi:histidinol-phosphate aminotransferase